MTVGDAAQREALANGMTPVVYVDGRRIERVVTNDEIGGTLTYHPFPLTVVNDEVEKRTLRGVVGIELEAKP